MTQEDIMGIYLTTPWVLVFTAFTAESVNALYVKGVVFLRLLILNRAAIFVTFLFSFTETFAQCQFKSVVQTK